MDVRLWIVICLLHANHVLLNRNHNYMSFSYIWKTNPGKQLLPLKKIIASGFNMYVVCPRIASTKVQVMIE